MSQRVVVATRKSALALAQTRAFVAELRVRHADSEFEELLVTTTGDRVVDRPLSEIGGKGLFVKEIEEALLEGRADFAVHSLKDVPPELMPSLMLGCFPEREDPRDVLISRTGQLFLELPKGSRVGTSSLRRRVQLQALRPDLEYVPLRGNVDTRIRKCREGELQAVVLALAGLLRLGRAQEATEILDTAICLPAVGQGALAIELRAQDSGLLARLAVLSHAETELAVTTERGVMRAVAGNCQTPVAAYAVRQGEELWLRGMLAAPDGSKLRRSELRAPWPNNHVQALQLGMDLGAALI